MAGTCIPDSKHKKRPVSMWSTLRDLCRTSPDSDLIAAILETPPPPPKTKKTTAPSEHIEIICIIKALFTYENLSWYYE